jgi:hypothetical protein
MCVGITVVDRAKIAAVVVADVVVVDARDVRLHFWNICHRNKDRQRRNKALRCSINVAVTLELVSVAVVTEAD